MAKYFRQDISAEHNLPRPPLGPLLGGQLARRTALIAAFRAQDRVLPTCRRMILRQSLSGARSFLVPDTDPAGVGAVQTHPEMDVPRLVARARVDRTPGCFLRVRALCALSGASQRPGVPDYTSGGVSGDLILTAIYQDSAGTESVTRSKTVPGSPLEFGAAPSDPESQWKSLRVVTFNVRPPLGTKALVNRWSLPSIVTLELYHRNGLRVIDCTVDEVPVTHALEAEDAALSSCAHQFAAGSPSGPAPSFSHPLQRLSEDGTDGDPRAGSWRAMDVANAQEYRLGPTLLHWTAYDEDDESVSATEATAVTTSSTSFVGLHNVNLTAYDDDNEGYSLAVGAYARARKFSDPVGMSNNGVIPVRVRVLCAAGNGTTTGVVRVQSGPYSWVDVVVPASTTYAWRSMFGFARVGRGPGQASVTQIFFRRTSGASTINVRDVVVHYAGLYAPIA